MEMVIISCPKTKIDIVELKTKEVNLNNIVKKIPVQDAKHDQIVLIKERFEIYGKYIDFNDVIYNFSERNIFGDNGKINYSDYNTFVYDYDRIEELANNEKEYSSINELLAENNTTTINYDLNTFFMNDIPENISTNYTFSSNTVDNFLYCIVKELISNVKNIKFECCRNCGYWFINTNSNEQKYCDYIFENNMTCNEIAKEERSKKNEKDDVYLQKCRKRYIYRSNE